MHFIQLENSRQVDNLFLCICIGYLFLWYLLIKSVT